MKIYYESEFEQKSEEWHNVRLGKITGSEFYKLTGTKAAATKYLYQKVSEIITKTRCDSASFSNVHMQRGLHYEEMAKNAYSLHKNCSITSVSIVVLNDYVACSPDGFVDNDGLIEIKIPDSHNYLENVLEITKHGLSAINSQHLHQIQFNLFVTQRQYCDYVLYNHNYQAYNSGLFIYRIFVDNLMQSTIANIVQQSIEKIEELELNFLSINL